MARNPFAFRPGPVAFWTTMTYIALFVALIIVQEVVPSPDLSAEYDERNGVNMTEAWLDLATLTSAYHPYNSRRNEEVREWLIERVGEIIADNNCGSDRIQLFNDLHSNVTLLQTVTPFAGSNRTGAIAAYFESSNVGYYIRGRDDPSGEWWNDEQSRKGRAIGKGGFLLNAHFDSVSTGFGATDNGMGVVSAMQTINHFCKQGNQPSRGIVVLFNNGEEDGLNGIRVLSQSPLLPFCHTFLNLEGAGNGGRAFMFRSTDFEVARAYQGTKHPFANVMGTDIFKAGALKSQTDYKVLDEVFGLRGSDISFYKWRAVYHTKRDDVVHTSKASLQHMLSGVLTTAINLSGDTGDTFVGQGPHDGSDSPQNGIGHDGVFFSVLGSTFLVFPLRGMLAWSISALVIAPLILILVTYLLHKKDRYYFFTSKVNTYEHPDFEPVKIGGFKGFLRYPFALLISGALTFGSALLLVKFNPFIVYSSHYAVWAMMLSLFYFVFWAIMQSANFARPSALHRGYANLWLFIFSWAGLVIVTVIEDRFGIASGYILVWLELVTFLSTLITLLELLALPKKQSWAQHVREDHEARDHLEVGQNDEDLIAPSPGELQAQRGNHSGRYDGGHHDNDGADDDEDEDEERASERTPLVSGRAGRAALGTTFANTYRRSISKITKRTKKRSSGKHEAYPHEQPWSGRLPTWTWLPQFLILGPIMIILTAEIGLTVVESVAQTGVDGSSPLVPYLAAALFSILILVPLTPFMHRLSAHFPLLLLAVLIGTLAYDLFAFPFSPENRFKAFFQQQIDLNTGASNVTLTGIEKYVKEIIAAMPSAAGVDIECSSLSLRNPLTKCSWDGAKVLPRLQDGIPDGIPPNVSFDGLLTVNATRTGDNTAQVQISAVNSKNVVLAFDRPVSHISIENGTNWDDRFGTFPEDGVSQIRLWHREFNGAWIVNVAWDAPKGGLADGVPDDPVPGMDGVVAAQWADANTPGTIPALDEALKFCPNWATISKIGDGLVEGRKSFHV